MNSNIFQRRSKLTLHISILLLLISIGAIAVINVSSLIAYFYFMLLTSIIYVVTLRKWSKEVIGIFIFYGFITILIFALQYISAPHSFGFTPAGIGTDDSFFYSTVADNLPPGFPVRPPQAYFTSLHYSLILGYITPFRITHPFDILFANCMAATFVPIYTREVAKYINKDKSVAYYAFLFSLICPFLMSNSLILIRDGWTATLLIGCIYFLFRNKWFFLALFLGLLLYIRLGSGIMALPILAFFFYQKLNIQKKKINKYLRLLIYSSTIIILIAGSLYIFPMVKDFLFSKGLTSALFRAKDLMREFGGSQGLVALYSQPFYIRIPVGTIFFTLMPLLNVSSLVKEGIFIPRHIFSSLLYPLLFLFYLKYILTFVFNERNLWKNYFFQIFLFFIGSMLIISQVSMQARHKTMFMPLFYLVVGYSYGKFKYVKDRKALGLTAIYFVAILLFRLLL